MLANRLKPLLNHHIYENQSAFVPSRLITDNVMLAFEAQHFMRRKTQGKEGYVALKLDMSKAFDKVEWPMLEGIMLRVGFCERWVNLIMKCVTTVKCHILVEGEEIGPICPQRGVRKGDPLSPYLFILVVEGLSALIRRYESRGLFHGIAIAKNAPKISHLLFADDSFIFFKANAGESQIYRDILDIYAAASGQVVNFENPLLLSAIM